MLITILISLYIYLKRDEWLNMKFIIPKIDYNEELDKV